MTAIGDGDASLGEHIFDVSEAEIKAMVKPDGVTDNRLRKTVAMVTELRGLHGRTLSVTRQVDNAVWSIA